MKTEKAEKAMAAMWRQMPKGDREMLIAGSAEALLSTEPDISTEQLIQRLIDAFRCDHSEVCNALKRLA